MIDVLRLGLRLVSGVEGLVLRDQAGEWRLVQRTSKKGMGDEEVKEAKATPDLVAAAGEKRNSMTAGRAGELMLSQSRRRWWWRRRRSLLVMRSEELCCIVLQRRMLAGRRIGAGGRMHDVKGNRIVGGCLDLSSKKSVVRR